MQARQASLLKVSNLPIQFINWCWALLSAKSAADLTAIQAEMKETILVIEPSEIPYPMAMAIYREAYSALELVHDIKQDQCSAAPDFAQFTERLQQFTTTRQSKEQSQYLLTNFMSMYARIIINVMALDVSMTELTMAKRQQLLMAALKITEDIARLVKLANETTNKTHPHIATEVIADIRAASFALIEDNAGNENNAEKCSLALVNVLVNKLLTVRKFLEEDERSQAAVCGKLLSNKPCEEFLVYQKTHQYLAILDSFIRRLNLHDHQGLRRKYKQQFEREKKSTGEADLLLCDYKEFQSQSIVQLNISLVNYTNHLVYNIGENEAATSCMIMGSANGRPPSAVFVRAMQQSYNLFYIKARMAHCHVMLLSRHRMSAEAESSYHKRLAVITALENNCVLATRLAYAMQAMVDRTSNREDKFNADMIEAAEDLLECDFNFLDFGNATNTGYAGMLSLVLIQQARLLLQLDKLGFTPAALLKRKTEPEEVMKHYSSMIVKFMIRLGENELTLSQVQVVLDFYYGLLRLCKNEVEAGYLVRLQRNILKTVTYMPNSHAYEFLNLVMIVAIANKQPIDKIDKEFFSYFNAEQLAETARLIKTAVKSFEQTPVYMLNAELKADYFSWMISFLDFQLAASNADKLFSDLRSTLTGGVEDSDDFVERCLQDLLPVYSDLKPLRLLKPVALQTAQPRAENSFTVEQQKTPTKGNKPKGKKKKRKNQTPVNTASQKTPPQESKRPPEPNVDIQNLLTFFNNDILELAKYLQSKLVNRRNNSMAMHALVALARCIDKAPTTHIRTKVIKILTDHESEIIRTSPSVNADFDALNAEYMKLTDGLITRVPAVQPLVTYVGVPSPAKPVTPKQSTHAYLTYQFKTPTEKPPVLRRLNFESEPSAHEQPFYSMPCDVKSAPDFKIELNAYQQNLVNKLIAANMFPLGQGAMGVESIVGMERRDTDMLCFAPSAEKLEDLLKQCMDELSIVSVEQNTKKQRLEILFRPDPARPELETKLILAYRIAANPAHIPKVLLPTAKGYCLPVIYVNLADMSLVDPLRQGRNIANGKLDVGHFDNDLDQYYYSKPERIFDAAYRLSRFEKHKALHKKEFMLSERLNGTIADALNHPGDIIEEIFRKRISVDRFDKLYLFGHGTESNKVLSTKPFHCLDKVFGFLKNNAVNQAIFAALCQETDAKMQHVKTYNLSTNDLDALRCNFFSELFSNIISGEHPEWRQDNTYNIYIAVRQLMSQTGFIFSKTLRQSICEKCEALISEPVIHKSLTL